MRSLTLARRRQGAWRDMLNFHIIMPFYREYLFDVLKKDIGNMNVYWHPVCDPREMEYFKDNTEPWIKPLPCAPLIIPGDQCYRKINDFVDAGDIIDDHWYGFIGDDDIYAPGFCEKICKFINSKIVIFSMSRGDYSPATDSPYQWPAIPIYQHSLQDIRVANIDLCQMVVRGEILKKTRFGNSSVCDDGHYAETLKARWPKDICILSEIGVFKSFYEQGRYLTDVNTFRTK
jgi:hypothetical protein